MLLGVRSLARARARGPARGRARRGTSRCSRGCRSSTPGPGHSPRRGQGSGLWPHSPATALGPTSTRPSTAMPPPVPSPRSRRTRRAPRARAVRRLGQGEAVRVVGQAHGPAQARLQVAVEGRPLSQVEFAFLTRPVAGEIAPGMPTPTVPRRPLRLRRPRRARRWHRGSRVVVARGGHAPPRADGVVPSRAMASILVPPRSTPMRSSGWGLGGMRGASLAPRRRSPPITAAT